MSEVTESPETANEEDDAPSYQIGPRDIVCGAGIILGIVARYVFLALTPSMLVHHGVLLEALDGANAAIVGGGALARDGHQSLFLVMVAPLCTILIYDVFYWWAGRLWGSRVAEFYAQNNPRMGRWIHKAEGWVRRGGVWTLAIGYFLPIPTNVIFLACGTSGMSVWIFLIGDAIGVLLWDALLVGLGWAIGHPAVHVINQIGHYSLYITIGLVVLIVIIAGIRGQRMAKNRT